MLLEPPWLFLGFLVNRVFFRNCGISPAQWNNFWHILQDFINIQYYNFKSFISGTVQTCCFCHAEQNSGITTDWSQTSVEKAIAHTISFIHRFKKVIMLWWISWSCDVWILPLSGFVCHRPLSTNAETKDFAHLTSHSVWGWMGKTKLFVLLGLKMATVW